MKRKKVLCLLCAAAVMFTSIPFAPTRAYASQVNQEESQIGENQSGDATDNGGTEEPTENIWEDETGLYEVLKQDAQGRELVARSGNVYFTTEYDDANSTITQYCSEGPLEGNNYDRKTTTRQVEENEFHSISIVTTETASGTTVEEYDGDDNLTRSVAEDGETTVNYYEDGNLVKAIQPYTGTPEDALHTSTYEYDASGNLTTECTPAAQNEDGSISYARQEYEYDAEGNMVSYRKAVNAPGEPEAYVRTDYAYDGNGNLTMTTEYDTDGSVLAIAQYYYDEEGNKLRQYTGLTSPLTITGLDQVTPGADTDYQVTAYEYENGKLVKETDPEGRSTAYRYGEDGMLAESTDKNGTRHVYAYREGTFRESEEIYYPGNNTGAPDETIEYIQDEEEDGSPGMLTEIRGNGQSTQYSYDENASLIRETDANGNSVTYEYDEGQNITAISVEDASGSTLGETCYSYNEDGSLAAISDGGSQPVAQYEYDGEGNVQAEAAGNGNRTEYEYDISGRPTDMEVIHADGGTAADYSYTYAVDGTLKEEAERVQGTCTSYEYDGMGRLESETVAEEGEEETTAYEYDASGNRTGIETEEGTIQSEYDGANRLTKAGEDAVSYDANGNLTQYGGISYEYDARNRLTSVQTPEHTIRYEYDVNDRLINRDVDGNREEFIWANGVIVAKTGTEHTYYYTDMQAGVKASEDADGVQYYASGKRGDIIETTDENGETIENMSYDAAGQQEKEPEGQEDPKEEPQEQGKEKSGEETQDPAEQEGKESQEEAGQEEPQGFEPGYTGSFYDHEAGLVYLNARFYSPGLGCFLSEDTVEGNEEELMTLNRYAYCRQDPVNYTDPGGHWPKSEHKGMSEAALKSMGYSNSLINKCVALSVVWADEEFHYSNSPKQPYNPQWSSWNRNRLNIKNLQRYCDQGRVNGNAKSNQFEAPYHGRGEYYLYLPYLLGLALQFDKGYTIDHLALRNDNIMYQQMNFDMLINLSGLYENKKGKTLSRKEYSYLILGIALHLVEDMWAHVAVINDSEQALNAYKECFDIYEQKIKQGNKQVIKKVDELRELKTLLKNGKPICYLNMSNFCKDGKKYVNGKWRTFYNITHTGLAEGTGKGSGGEKRKKYAQNAAARLLGYFKNGYIMHSGSKKLSGGNQANLTDRKRLRVSKCAKGTLKPITITLKNGKEITYGRYVCSACENGSADACYRIYYSDKKKGMGLGYMFLRPGNAI